MGLVRSLQENPYAELLASSPLLSIFSTFVITCVVTRLVTGFQSTIAQNNRDVDKKTPNQIAYWLPWVGSAISFARNIEGTISRDRYVNLDDLVWLAALTPT
jgi:hypothetical protein